MPELSALLAIEWLMFNAPRPWVEEHVQRFTQLCVNAPSKDLLATQAVLGM